jgi:hypothetical protein
MNFFPVFVDAVKGPGSAGIDAGHVIAVVGKMFAGREPGRLADDFVAFNDEVRAISVVDHPFTAEERDGAIRAVFDGDEVNERVRLVFGQAHAAVMINEFIETGGDRGVRVVG